MKHGANWHEHHVTPTTAFGEMPKSGTDHVGDDGLDDLDAWTAKPEPEASHHTWRQYGTAHTQTTPRIHGLWPLDLHNP